MTDAFPHGLPPPPANMPAWSLMDYDQFARFYRTVDLGCFLVPLANVNIHSAQRPLDQDWLVELQKRFRADGVQANAHPGVAILNTEHLPLDEDGKPDPLQMSVSIIDGQHRGAARLAMNDPDSEKCWVLRIFAFGIFKASLHCGINFDHNFFYLLVLHHAPSYLLGAWISSYNQAPKCWVTSQYSSDDQIHEDHASLVSPTGEISWLDNF